VSYGMGAGGDLGAHSRYSRTNDRKLTTKP
jgi:hypothetical protein